MVFKMKKVIVYTDWYCQPHFTPVHALIQCFCVQFLHFGKKDAQRQKFEPFEPWTSKIRAVLAVDFKNSSRFEPADFLKFRAEPSHPLMSEIRAEPSRQS